MSDCLAADKVTYDHISLNYYRLTYDQADRVPAGTLKIGSGAPLVQMCSHPAQTTAMLYGG